MPVNLHANPSGGSRQIGVGVQGLEPRNQALMRVANFPMGAMAELMSAVVFSGHLRPPSRRALCPRGGRGRLGPLHVLALRPRIRVWRTADPRLQARHRALPQAQRDRQAARLLHLRGRGRGRFPTRARDRSRQFPVGQRLPRPRQPVAAFEGDGPCPLRGRARATALDQLVFENARNLYKIPVTLPQQRAVAAK